MSGRETRRTSKGIPQAGPSRSYGLSKL
ncbi:hypothetical protein OIU76_019437, partial [Salix suchowensis]